MSNIPRITPVILSGGYGTRLWPASRPDRPKQLITLVDRYSLLQTTVLRIAKCDWVTSPVIVTNKNFMATVVEQLGEIGVKEFTLVLEPSARGTAPAAAIVALMIAEKCADTILALLPSDHTIAHEGVFLDAIKTAALLANNGSIVTFGIPPKAPETGYGYMHRGEPIAKFDGCYQLDGFVEKPDQVTAKDFLADGNYLWNSGMYIFSASTYLYELERFEPVMLDMCRRAFDDALEKNRYLYLAEPTFATCPEGSIDRVIMEKIDSASVIPVDLGWNDIGAWTAVWEVCSKDNAGNVIFGNVEVKAVRESLVYNECNSCLEVSGIRGLVVVSTESALFVAERSRSAEIGQLASYLTKNVDQLPISDACVSISDGIQIVKIGCKDIRVSMSLETVHVCRGNTSSGNLA